jgi:hypothetical protein
MSAASGVVTGGGDPTDFTLTGDTTTDAAASGSLVGVLSSSGSATRTADITLTGNTTTDAAASGSLVGTLS